MKSTNLGERKNIFWDRLMLNCVELPERDIKPAVSFIDLELGESHGCDYESKVDGKKRIITGGSQKSIDVEGMENLCSLDTEAKPQS